MEPVVDKLREGVSIAIAPEGTRSVSYRLGPFKKGAFHIAMQAGVPVVPIVIRNAGELMWRNSFWLRPGTVDVRVLKPIPTHKWKAETIDDHVAKRPQAVREGAQRPRLVSDQRDDEALHGPRGQVAVALLLPHAAAGEAREAEAAEERARHR